MNYTNNIISRLSPLKHILDSGKEKNKTPQSYSTVPLVFICLILTFQKLDFYLDRVSSFFCKVQDSKYFWTFISPLLL